MVYVVFGSPALFALFSPPRSLGLGKALGSVWPGENHAVAIVSLPVWQSKRGLGVSLASLYVLLKLVQHSFESALSALNFRYAMDEKRAQAAATALSIPADDMAKTKAYSRDKFRYGQVSGWITTLVSLVFLWTGGLGWVEALVTRWTQSLGFSSPVLLGLGFFALLGVLSYLLSLPFDLYFTFVLEQKHGFNRQTWKGFVSDQIKGALLGIILGGLVLSLLLSVMQKTGNSWWWMAWLLLFAFNLLTAWLYPTLLAPLFNTFSPLEEGALKEAIFELAKKIDFKTDGISIMDASRRSAHGNAYFTGVFGKKRIVLFDTLVKSMGHQEIVAVLAHELGHFKLNHVRWSLIRAFFTTGLTFFALSLCLPLKEFYQAFGLQDVSYYGALVIFSLWFGPIGFILRPLGSLISRRNEFAADAFALQQVPDKRSLGDALLKLRENSHVMPLSHPLYSAIYHSHPPLLERLKAMGYIH